MIIECEKCSKKFEVQDNLIPVKGRLLQCGSCAFKWHYIPKTKTSLSEKTETIEKNELIPHNHDVELNLHVEKEDIKEENFENIQTKLDLSKIYSDSSLEELKFDLHSAGYLSNLNDKNSISSQ